tara:strand:- start:37 stop:621 length:585 start_codon:yes stop_codon:yes gene_type:complete
MPFKSKICIGCDNLAKTAKGWCSQKCYANNQKLNGENKGWFKKGNKHTVEQRKKHSERLRKWHRDNPEKSRKAVEQMNTEATNKKKGHLGKLNPRWINDRSKLKNKRCFYEEREFFKEVLKDRNYTCELTGVNDNKLSVHHIDSVQLYPEKMFDKDNVIVITKDIHLDFHKKMGFQGANRIKWDKYLLENNYVK